MYHYIREAKRQELTVLIYIFCVNRDLNPEFDVVVDGLNLGFASARSGTWRNNRNDQNDKRALTGQYKVRKIS